ncbi:MAG: hypothetical protein ACR2QC_11995 [Gammaproteobacteria bacterium]
MIRRVKKERWEAIPVAAMEDDLLSWKARGLLAFILVKPDGWEIRKRQLINSSHHDGETSVQSALKELVRAGYAKLIRYRDAKSGQIPGSRYEISDYPSYNEDITREAENLVSGKSGRRKPALSILDSEETLHSEETLNANTSSRARENPISDNRDQKRIDYVLSKLNGDQCGVVEKDGGVREFISEDLCHACIRGNHSDCDSNRHQWCACDGECLDYDPTVDKNRVGDGEDIKARVEPEELCEQRHPSHGYPCKRIVGHDGWHSSTHSDWPPEDKNKVTDGEENSAHGCSPLVTESKRRRHPLQCDHCDNSTIGGVCINPKCPAFVSVDDAIAFADSCEAIMESDQLPDACSIYHMGFPCEHEREALAIVKSVVWPGASLRLKSHPNLHQFIHDNAYDEPYPERVKKLATWWKQNRRFKDWGIPLMFSRPEETMATIETAIQNGDPAASALEETKDLVIHKGARILTDPDGWSILNLRPPVVDEHYSHPLDYNENREVWCSKCRIVLGPDRLDPEAEGKIALWYEQHGESTP